MSERAVSTFGYALLGLLQQAPLSGYDLRKMFATTPLANFSDSPGAVYPALERLERQGLILGRVQGPRLRPRRVFHLKPAGEAAIRQWLQRPLAREDVMRGLEATLLRFGFMDQVLGRDASARFLVELERELGLYLRELRHYHGETAASMPLSGRLALESGLMSYETMRRWARYGSAAYAWAEQEKKK